VLRTLGYQLIIQSTLSLSHLLTSLRRLSLRAFPYPLAVNRAPSWPFRLPCRRFTTEVPTCLPFNIAQAWFFFLSFSSTRFLDEPWLPRHGNDAYILSVYDYGTCTRGGDDDLIFFICMRHLYAHNADTWPAGRILAACEERQQLPRRRSWFA